MFWQVDYYSSDISQVIWSLLYTRYFNWVLVAVFCILALFFCSHDTVCPSSSRIWQKFIAYVRKCVLSDFVTVAPRVTLNFINFFWNADENKDSDPLLLQANTQCEWMWRIYFKFIFIAFIGPVSMYLISVLLVMKTHGSFNVDRVTHIIRAELVFKDLGKFSII